MQQVRSRRELYSEATRAALLDEATRLFAQRGYARTSLEDVAAASRVTRGAVYHHFDGKQALFEAVLDAQETRAIARITAAATAADPLDAARGALDAFLDQCCNPVYGSLVWLEGPTALGWHRWRECEQKYKNGLVERFITALVERRLPGRPGAGAAWSGSRSGCSAAPGSRSPRRPKPTAPPARRMALPHRPDHLRPARPAGVTRITSRAQARPSRSSSISCWRSGVYRSG